MSLTMKGLPSGKAIDIANPHIYDFEVSEIAELLGSVKRFNGLGCSVAEHSLNVSNLLMLFTGNPHIALMGLLHDAQEAFIGDIATPVKHAVWGWEIIENKVYDAIIAQLHPKNKYTLSIQPLIKWADALFLKYEYALLRKYDVYREPKHDLWDRVLAVKYPSETIRLVTTDAISVTFAQKFVYNFHELKSLCKAMGDNFIEAQYTVKGSAFTCFIQPGYEPRIQKIK